jgi:hypothetical protein
MCRSNPRIACETNYQYSIVNLHSHNVNGESIIPKNIIKTSYKITVIEELQLTSNISIYNDRISMCIIMTILTSYIYSALLIIHIDPIPS